MTSSAPFLPRPIIAGVVGLVSTIAIIVSAVALRSPLKDYAPEGSSPPRSEAAPSRAEPSASPGGAALRASAAALASASAAPSAPADAREARARLHKDVESQRFKEAVTSFTQLLELDPAAPADSDVHDDIVELSMRVMLIEGPEPDAVFERLSSGMGTAGVDVLYELMTTRGGSRAARRAEELLKDEDLRGRGSPALRVAYELRTAKGCNEKIALLDKAKADGDGRTLGQLQLLNRACSRRSGDCCLHNDPRVRAAMDGIKERLN